LKGVINIMSSQLAIPPGAKNMREDDIENDDLDEEEDDDEDEEDLPGFSLEEVALGEGLADDIVITKRTIHRLGDVVAFANKSGRRVRIESCLLRKANVHATDTDVVVEETLFEEGIQCRSGIFGGKLWFEDVGFDEEAEFSGAVFKEDVVFEDCIFADRVNFFQTVFKKNAVFSFCDFEEDVVFDHARFLRHVNLSESTFRKSVSCRGTRFESSVALMDTVFEQPPETTGSNLADAQKIASAEQASPKNSYRKRESGKKAEFNPWREWDKASKKNMTRRHLLRGLFRFLPEDKEES
jgi:hypothetical protein